MPQKPVVYLEQDLINTNNLRNRSTQSSIPEYYPLKFKWMMTKIEEQLMDSKIDYEKVLEDVRANAWEEYKKDFLN